jgi:hypothetical protein
MDKRYLLKYGMSLIADLKQINQIGVDLFLRLQYKKWTCQQCGRLLTVHKVTCIHCGSENPFFPVNQGFAI